MMWFGRLQLTERGAPPSLPSLSARLSITRRRLLWLVACLSSAPVLDNPSAKADTLQHYAAQCDAAIGETVPDFDCDAGTEVPMTNAVLGDGNYGILSCDEPNRLNNECDPGS